MNRQSVLILIIVFFALAAVIFYYGAMLTLWSSVAFTTLASLFLLNILYPPGQTAVDDPDFTLAIYVLLEIVGLVILCAYVIEKTLTDTRIPTEV